MKILRKKNKKQKQHQFKFKTSCDHYYNIFAKRDEYAKYQFLSPFELKNILLKNAQNNAQKKGIPLLDSGRGNPNFLSTIPREAFGLLQIVAAKIAGKLCKNMGETEEECYGLGMMPDKKGIAKIFFKELKKYQKENGYRFLMKIYPHMLSITHYNDDELIHQLLVAILGSYYPVPPQIQPFVEKIMLKFIANCLFKNKKSEANIELFATEGATAAIIYFFNTLFINGIINKGDKIGILTPIFTPYLELPHIHRFQLKHICIEASQELNWEIPDKELDKLKDPEMKALFVVNPTNPTSHSLSNNTLKKIGNLVRKYNKNLVILVDNVYAPFVEEYNSLFNELPFNTIGVYSLSKYFGTTGWRLGVAITHKNNVIDKNILPHLNENIRKIIKKRYEIAVLDPHKLTFMERLVLDSREVAEAHTGGLSTPQQTMMALFAMQQIIDTKNIYGENIKKILKRRIELLCRPLKYYHNTQSPRAANYYITLDLLRIAETLYGKNFREWIFHHVDPLKIIFWLANNYSNIVLPGVGFAAPPWTARVSLANLKDNEYKIIGNNIKKTFDDIYQIYLKE